MIMIKEQLLEAINELEAWEDRVVVLVDEYKSGRECVKCNGKGHLDVKCPHCGGNGYFKGRREDGPCPDCTIGEGPLSKSLGRVPCDLCFGQGTSSIIVPEDAEKRPTKGVITSVGPLCRYFRGSGALLPKPPDCILKIGDHVFFTLYSGNEFLLGPSNKQICIRILREAEILGKLRSNVKIEPETFQELADVGMRDTND